MKKGGFLRNVLDTIRSNQANASGSGSGNSNSATRGAEFGGQLKPQHFSLGHVARHGFPEQPSALAFDPVQKLAAIGTKTGALRIFGRPGVDIWAQHKPEYAVTHIRFIVNQGAIITVTSDESIHLWSLRGPNLKLQLSTTNSSPAQAAPANLFASSSPAQSSGFVSASSLSSPKGSAGTAATHHHQHNLDSGAQPGDPDYLLAECGVVTGTGTSPTGDKTSRQPEILHTLKFQREHITCLHQTLMSKWLYIGTERGNIHVVNVETFELSGYSIAWNKAIELSRKTHPGSIIHISECPQDSNKLLIGYESGCIVLWDLKARNADGRYYHTDNLLWLAWHYEGKQFVASHGDGSLITWQTRSNARPAQISHPHAKSQDENQPQTAMASFGVSSFARALNNELYRPINKVDWKTSKNNEQFLLFSGGLPCDGLDSQSQPQQQLSLNSNNNDPSTLRSQSTTGTLTAVGSLNNPLIGLQAAKSSNVLQANQQQPFLKPCSSASPNFATATSPTNMPTRQSSQQQTHSASSQQLLQQKEKKSLRSTSLTVMYGKSITVLEMDDTIIDFITICDIAPYENDTSDPYAVIVLLSNDLILIDLTSSGYPSFDSPYPSSQLNESPVTCVQYLADCSSDLIPFLYSNSQNVVSRAPKKGFSDKEWPIDGGEWGQSMQSYPELVITGHADGTIKFWDMSGVNFDLISKIKTSRIFERPNRLPNSVIIPYNKTTGSDSHSPSAIGSDRAISSPILASSIEENLFAIEKIEYCSATKHLLVAGAFAQVIQFKLNKKDQQTSVGANELTTILVEQTDTSTGSSSSDHPNQSQLKLQQQKARQHLFLKARPSSTSSCSSNSSASAQVQRNRSNGFQVELVCLTPLLVSSCLEEQGTTTPTTYYCQAPPKVTALALQETHNILAYTHENGLVLVDIIQKCLILNATLSDLYGCSPSSMSSNRDNISIQPFATSSILQHHYQANAAAAASLSSHSNSEFNTIGGSTTRAMDAGAATGNHNNSSMPNNGCGEAARASEGANDFGGTTGSLYKSTPTGAGGNGGLYVNEQKQASASNSQSPSLSKNVPFGSGAKPTLAGAAAAGTTSNQLPASTTPRFNPANSMFQRQMSTTALQRSSNQAAAAALANNNNSAAGAASSALSSGAGAAGTRASANRLFQRQTTASQLYSSSAAAAAASSAASGTTSSLMMSPVSSGGRSPIGRRLNESISPQHPSAAAPTAADSSSEQASSTATTTTNTNTSGSNTPPTGSAKQQRATKNKRIISRMLSISAIHTSVGASFGGNSSNSNASSNHSSAAGVGSNIDSATSNTQNGSHHHNASGTGTGTLTTSSTSATTNGEQVADKIDSSFTRSRSSSSSSNAPAAGASNNNEANAAAHHVHSQQQQQQSSGEFIQCLCFLDWTLATRSHQSAAAAAGGGGGGSPSSASAGQHASGGTGSNATGQAAAAGNSTLTNHSSAGAGAGGASAACSAGGATSAQSKSLNSIDNSTQAPGQLGLYLGTSQGCVLLVYLSLPDSEDNRVLQLQSVSAEPIPQAAIKMSGAILCLSSFTSERAPACFSSSSSGGGIGGATTALAGAPSTASGPGSLTTPSSSLESDQNPLATPTSTSSSLMRGVAAAGGGGQGDMCASSGAAFFGEARSSCTFLAIVSEKQAKVYQIPSGPWTTASNQGAGGGQQTQGGATSGSTSSGSGGTAKQTHSDHHHHQQQHAKLIGANQADSSGADSPMAKLLINKANCLNKIDLSDSSYACCSGLVSMRQPDECCLISYLATGNLLVHSLPRMRCLMEADFVPYTSGRISSSMRFSRNGHCLYQPSKSEICKFTLSSHYKSLVNEMTGQLHVAREMPEMPRGNFFKSLFSVTSSVASKQSDRDELFGDAGAGKASRNVAKYVGSSIGPGGGGGSGAIGGGASGASSGVERPGPSGLDKLKGAAVGTMGHDMRMAREGLDERGEKLSDIEDKTLQMMNSSESYAQAAHQLAQKFKDKKWYQF